MTCIAVLGIPRSGTSAVAGICHHLGLYMGDEFLPAGRNNEKGFFEDVRFVDLHFCVSVVFEGCRYEPEIPTMTTRDFFSDMGPRWTRRYTDMVRGRDRLSLWGVKEPRFCYLLPHFLTLVNDVRIISTGRPFQQSVNSMAASHGLTQEVALSGQQCNIAAKEQVLSMYNGPLLNVAYEDILEDPTAQVARIADFIGLPVTDEAVRFVDPSLQRHKTEGVLAYA